MAFVSVGAVRHERRSRHAAAATGLTGVGQRPVEAIGTDDGIDLPTLFVRPLIGLHFASLDTGHRFDKRNTRLFALVLSALERNKVRHELLSFLL